MKILVVGCGVSGLSCGVSLQQQGFSVMIYSKEIPPQTTSNRAGAIWFPYKASPPQRVNEWSRVTYCYLREVAKDPSSGVVMTKLVEIHAQDIEEPWWKDAVPGECFHRAKKEEIPPAYTCGFAIQSPLVHPDQYLNYLMKEFQQGGGEIVKKNIQNLEDLLSQYPVVVNCTGLGSREILGDEELYPIQGHMIKLDLSVSYAYFDDTSPDAPAYVLSRGKECVVGGTAVVNDEDTRVRLDLLAEVLKKGCRLFPHLRYGKILDAWVGLRPGRSSVRLEKQEISPSSSLVHNYGHGGSGFTLSWGCAQEVVKLVKEEVERISLKS